MLTTIWEATVAPDTCPARRFLAETYRWPPAGWAHTLPADVRWLPVDRQPPPIYDLKWYGLPREAAGALVFAYRPPSGGDLAALACEAFTASGAQVPYWRRVHRLREWRPTDRYYRVYGPRTGHVFRIEGYDRGDQLMLCEDEYDALALALVGGVAEVRCTGHASGFSLTACEDSASRAVVLAPLPMSASRRATARLAAVLQASGRECHVLAPSAGLAIRSYLRGALASTEGTLDPCVWESPLSASARAMLRQQLVKPPTPHFRDPLMS